METIVITGATGNLGSRTTVEFLTKTDAHLILLIYAENETSAVSQVKKVLSFWNVEYDEFADRIWCVPCDLTKPKAGIHNDLYQEIASRVTNIIHCAASFKLNLSLEEARSSIVGATRTLTDLAGESHQNGTFERFNYISSLDAAGDMKKPIPETYQPSREKNFLNTYQQAKAEAEDLLFELNKRTGFPFTVYRPSMLVGDSRNGKIINPQSLYHVINDMYLNPALKTLPGKHFRIDPIPIDIAASALLHMHNVTETENQFYNLASGSAKAMPLSVFLQKLDEIYTTLDGTKRSVPRLISPHLPYVVLGILKLITFGKLRKKFSEQFDSVRYFFIMQQPITEKTHEVLRKYALEIPPLPDYLPVLCEYIYVSKKDPVSLHN